MSSQRMLKRWVIAAALVALTAPATAWAQALQFFEASAGSGNTLVVNQPVPGGLLLNLDYDASSAEFGTLFGFFVEVGVGPVGDLTLDVFTCEAAICLANLSGFPNSFTVSAGDDIQGETGVMNLGLLTISGTFGTVEILGGTYFDEDAPNFERDIDPFVLAQVVPEPGTLILLGAGLAGLALLRRRSA